MKIWRFILLWLIPFSKFCFAQDPISFPITAEDGLPNQTIYSIIQDKKGFIWLGTDAGLYKYDGIRFKEYKNPHQKSRSVTGLTVAKNNRLYMYNFSGQIFFIENDSLHNLNSWSKGNVSNITTDTSGNLWVAYSKGIELYSIKDKTWKVYKSHHIQSNNTHSCFVDENNVFWAIGPSGIVSINNNKYLFFDIKWSKNMNSGNYQLAFYSKEKFIMSRVGAEVFVLKNNKIVPFYSKNLNPLLLDKKITRVEEDKNRKLWIYTYSGIIIYDILNDKSELLFPNNSFSGSLLDDENTYWLATLDEGVFKLPEFDFKLWQIKNNDAVLSKINKIACKKNIVAYGTSDGKAGVLYINNQISNTVTLGTKLDVQCINFSNDCKSIFLSIQNTILKINDSKITEVSSFFPPTKEIKEYRGNYVIATSIGSFLVNQTNIKKYQELNYAWSRSININDITKKAYIATNKGVDIFDITNEKWNFKTTVIKDVQILSASASIENKLFALAFNGAIYEVNEKNQTKLLYKIPDYATVYQIKTDNENIYCSSNKGVWVISKKGELVKVINHLSGLLSDITSSIDINDNKIWIAHSKGVQEIPINKTSKKSLPRLYLKKIICKNSFNNNDKIILNYNEPLKIELEAVSLSSEEKYQYAYRINNQDWLYLPASIEEINFPSINDGDFKIEVKLINHLGESSIQNIILSGYVNPPFWQTWWFYSIIGLVCLFIGIVIFKERIKRLERKQAKELERINLEHQLKLSQETALRAQMNPHFIFNVLNSIKSYIYENDKKKAVGYLQRFSDLIRKILEQSSVSWVKLEEEINFLKLYIELESMLFSDDFDYVINIESDIDTNNSRIPSLILQPFIENAFKHGLRHKEGKKHITIDFKLEKNEILVVTITDNGIGREQSSIINQSKQNKHKSFSTEAINRVSILNKNQPGVVSVLYRDLMNDTGANTGTSVEIKINVNE